MTLANVCRTFQCTIAEAEAMLSPTRILTTIAVIDAMIMLDARAEEKRVARSNAAGQKRGGKFTPAQVDYGDATPFVTEVIAIGKRATDEEYAQVVAAARAKAEAEAPAPALPDGGEEAGE